MTTMKNPIQSGLVLGFSCIFDKIFDAIGVPDPNHEERFLRKREKDWNYVDEFMKKHDLGTEDDIVIPQEWNL